MSLFIDILFHLTFLNLILKIIVVFTKIRFTISLILVWFLKGESPLKMLIKYIEYT